MKILSVCDLHIGGGGKADDFKGDNAFIRWIKRIIIKHRVKRVFLLGDIFELWQFSTKAIRAAHFILCRFLEGKKFKRFRGNHDYQLFGPLTKTIVTKSGKRVLFSHCFQNDKWMTNPLSRFAIWLVGMTLEKIFPDIDNEDGYKADKNKSRIKKKAQAYVEKMFAHGYDIVFGGHIHGKAFIRKFPGGKIWVNCGHCTNNVRQGAIFDTLTDKITLV